MEIVAYIFIGGIALYLIIANAVKKANKEALDEFRKDIMNDIKQLLLSENLKKDGNASDTRENE